MLTAVPEIIRSLAAFVVVLGVLVFVHELGHYLAARWRGVRVETFSIGFGRTITSWTDRHGTVWKLSWLPLGGYVKMHGQERPEDVTEAERAAWIKGETFHEKTVLSRAIIVAAGPAANFLLAIVVFAGMFAILGKPVPDERAVIGEVVAKSAAQEAGLQARDLVLSIANEPVATFADLQRIVRAHPGDPLALVIQRQGAEQTLTVTPTVREQGTARIGMLGVKGGQKYVPVGLVDSVTGGAAQTWDITVETFNGLAQMITGRRGTEELGGPLRIAQLSGEVARLGVASLVTFIGVLSVNLGLINLFPVPVLDGGHLVFYLAEAVRGRPLPPKVLDYGFRAGLAVLAALFVFATLNDVTHLGLFRWVAGLAG